MDQTLPTARELPGRYLATSLYSKEAIKNYEIQADVFSIEDSSSGDFFCIGGRDNQGIIALCDVVGHSVQSGELARSLHNITKTSIEEFKNSSKSLYRALGDTIYALDTFAHLSYNHTKSGSDATGAIICGTDKDNFYCGTLAHHFPLVFSRKGIERKVWNPSIGGVSCGLGINAFTEEPIIQRASLDDGDVVVAFTDGIVELKEFGEGNLKDLISNTLKNNNNVSMEYLKNTICNEIRDKKPISDHDDATIVAMRYSPYRNS